jgi:transposase-like protein
MTFPPEHWSRIYSTNPLERVNREVKRRTNVVCIPPDADADRCVPEELANASPRQSR